MMFFPVPTHIQTWLCVGKKKNVNIYYINKKKI